MTTYQLTRSGDLMTVRSLTAPSLPRGAYNGGYGPLDGRSWT